MSVEQMVTQTVGEMAGLKADRTAYWMVGLSVRESAASMAVAWDSMKDGSKAMNMVGAMADLSE